jgi:P-type Ca2+ transporter type 2C
VANINTNISFHSVSAEEATLNLQSDASHGLVVQEVQQRLKHFGLNAIAEAETQTVFQTLIHQFKSPIVYLLLFAAALSFWFKEWLDGGAILVVIIINTVIGFFMEYQAGQSMKALKKLSLVPAKVIRDGMLAEVNSSEIVPGDLVFAEGGDLVPADGRIIRSMQLQANESALTGESIPVEKQNTLLPVAAQLADRTNMLYKGTYITRGNVYLLVTATGMETELGKIARLVHSSGQSATPLEKKLMQFSKKLIRITIILVVIIFFSGLLNGQKPLEMLTTAIALAVAAIPEGLPIVATMALARGMLKMAKHNVIVKKLSAVETLGGTTVICTDKTGTLTQNRVEVNRLLTPSGEWMDKKADITISDKQFELATKVAVLCNTAEIFSDGNELKEVGDPLETGLLKFAYSRHKDINLLRTENPKVDEEPFSSETKIMATLHEVNGSYFVCAKGAAEELLDKCKGVYNEDGISTLDLKAKEKWIREAENLASSGERVIAMAYRETNEKPKTLSRHLTFLGLVGMIDPPRPEVLPAIEECKSAGINVVMITGDHPSTAKKIGLELGIISNPGTEIIHGSQMKDYEELTKEEKNWWADTNVFARVNPRHKLDLVKVLQEKGNVVGMTGDGVNDAPALKKADIGIAMGERGTQVAQEVADMVLKDDSFSSIVVAIRQGRIIFENIRKFVIFLLSCNLSELFVIAVAAVMNLHFQLFPLQILFINLITDVLPALALGITRGSSEIMKQVPRPPGEPIIDSRRWKAIFCYSIIISLCSIGAVLYSHYNLHSAEGWQPQLCNNILFFTLILSQLLHVLNMGSGNSWFFRTEVFRNRYVWYSLIISIVGLITLVQFPVVKQALDIHDVNMADWSTIIIASMLSFILIQLTRKFKIANQ